jgi:hypothetical protein
MNWKSTRTAAYRASHEGLGCGVFASVQAKDLGTIEIGWAMSGRRPTPPTNEHPAA